MMAKELYRSTGVSDRAEVEVEVVVDIQTQNTQHAQIARQFALVAHAGQRLVGVGCDGGLLWVGSHLVGFVTRLRSRFKEES